MRIRPLYITLAAALVALLFAASTAHLFADTETPATPQAPAAVNGGQSLVSVMVEMEQPPAIEVYLAQTGEAGVAQAAAAGAAQAHLAAVSTAQAEVSAAIAHQGGQVLYQLQKVYNGVAVRVPAAEVAALAALPHVKAVHPLVPKQPDLARSVGAIGARQLWEGVAGVPAKGEGIRIAIIDTGVDYLHADFGGPGLAVGDNDTTIIGDVAGFPGVKVVGGYDFAGETYNADPLSPSYQPIPQPDPDPMDCYDHGTHVAGIAAGSGVTAAGATYAGPYDEATDYEALQIAPGVAPLASIYALKVFGCGGSSNLTELAIEWAVDPNGDGDFGDRVDVINLSLGSPLGTTYDPTAIASDNAARLGVLVVASAGNSGDTFFATGSPAAADYALSVASVYYAGGSEEEAPFTLSYFSARGPRRPDTRLKPDLAAPGEGIYSAALHAGSSGRYASGTSMAAPHAAGAMALLRQLYPDRQVEELKALAMNTAQLPAGGQPSLQTPYGPTRAGAGVLDLRRAVRSSAVAYALDQDGVVSVSFGAPEVSASLLLERNVRVRNWSAAPLTFTVEYTAFTDMPGVTITTPASITVPAAGEADFAVQLTADAATMRRARDATLATDQSSPRHWLSEESGWLILRPTPAPDADGQPELIVPLYAAPRQVAAVRSDAARLDFGAALSATLPLTLTGTDLRGVAPPTDVVSLVSPFALLLNSPNVLPGPLGQGQVDFLDHADLRYVGIASDYPHGVDGPGDATVYFALATYAPWATPNEVELNVHIDSDGDGSADYRLFNSNQWGSLGSDAFVSAVEVKHTGQIVRGLPINGISPLAYDAGLYHSSVMVLPVSAAEIGLTDSDTAFSFYVEGVSRERKQPVDVTPRLHYDLARQGLHITGQGQGPLFEARSGEALAVEFDLVAYGQSGARGLLLLHHHNGSGNQAETVQLRYTWPYNAYLPHVAAADE